MDLTAVGLHETTFTMPHVVTPPALISSSIFIVLYAHAMPQTTLQLAFVKLVVFAFRQISDTRSREEG